MICKKLRNLNRRISRFCPHLHDLSMLAFNKSLGNRASPEPFGCMLLLAWVVYRYFKFLLDQIFIFALLLLPVEFLGLVKLFCLYYISICV